MDARAWDERYAASELVWSARPNQFVATELADLVPGRALDLASGEGRNALWLAARGWEVTAVDFSLVGLDKGRSLQTRHPRDRDLNVDWVHADVLEYIPSPASYDLVLLAYLQLVPEQRRVAVHAAFSALRVGGTFFLVAHDSTNLTEGTGGPQDPSVLLTAEDVLADLDGERFEVQCADRVTRMVDQPDGSQKAAYDALVRLVRTA
ncbi:MAG TPA: class I SAM-dependent methyltransferase [Nocardioidaceae bacterium]|jgi:SAM-dependent methyltransferase|nr:class I SAM-dependent methyltransferase [Nocardioidaceae bacterium]